MPSQDEINHGDLQTKLQQAESKLTRLQKEIDQLQAIRSKLVDERERFKAEADIAQTQLAEAVTVAMRQRDKLQHELQRADTRGALFREAAELMEQTIEKLWRIIQAQQPSPPLPSETPQGYVVLGESRGE